MLTNCSLLLLAISYHINAKYEYNQIHPSIGVACNSFSTGYAVNSENNNAVWASYRHTFENKTYAELGIAHGYKELPIAPLIRIGYKFKYAEVFLMPGLENYNQQYRLLGIPGIQFSYPIN